VLAQIVQQGRPKLPYPLTTRADGQVTAQVMPYYPADRLMYPGITAEVWMKEGLLVGEVLAHQAAAYRDVNRRGKVALVLGAGNQGFLVTGDVLHKLLVEDQAVVLKMHPVNAYLGPLIEEGLSPFVRRGVLRVVYGEAEAGSHLVHHPLVDELHMTGSDSTFEAIVFGPGEVGQRRKQTHDPLVTKRFTAELGNISPLIVVPGPWRTRDIQQQARSIAAMLTHNAGFNCLTPRVLITYAGWPQREALLAAIEEALGKIPTRSAYYPGAEARHVAFTSTHPNATLIGEAGPGELPWTFISGVDPHAEDEICFTTEAFCGLMCETALEAPTPEAYLRAAVAFANDKLWGTLTATVLAHPKSGMQAYIEQALADLRYGTVGLNVWGALNYTFGVTTWGAYPGHDIYDVQSGIGVVNNMLMFHRPQKTVVRGPFTPFLTTSLLRPGFQHLAKQLAGWEAERAPIHLVRGGLASLRMLARS
jgi:hypothetical protein